MDGTMETIDGVETGNTVAPNYAPANPARVTDKIANDVPQIRRGMVWCTTCGRSERVDGADCLRNGWPKCCGYTMTIDSPDECRALTGKVGEA